MGCAASQPAQPDLLPAYCVRNPVLTPQHMALIRESWRCVVEGRKEGGGSGADSPACGTPVSSTSAGSSDVCTGSGAPPAGATGDDASAAAGVGLSVCPATKQVGSGCPHVLAAPEGASPGGSAAAADAGAATPDAHAAVLGPVVVARAAGDDAAAAAAAASALESDYPLVFFFDTFYARLFELAPQVRPLFRNSIKSQGRALVKMLDTAVHLLDSVHALRPRLEALALRHVAYGAKLEDFGVVGEALLYALRASLGPRLFTPDVEHAWLLSYSLMLSIMLPAAYGSSSPSATAAASTAAGAGSVPTASGHSGCLPARKGRSGAAAAAAPPPAPAQ
jgi:hemoglobin-like flavoprotein